MYIYSQDTILLTNNCIHVCYKALWLFRCEHVIRKWMSVEDDTYDGEDKSYGDVCIYTCISVFLELLGIRGRVFPYIPTAFIINHKISTSLPNK